MPERVVVVKRARRRSFALLWAVPAWVRSLWVALRSVPPAEPALRTIEFPVDARIPVLRFSADGNHRCTACDLCVQICPSQALRLADTIVDGRSRPRRFLLDLGACIGCRACAEVCPEDALGLRVTPAAVIALRSGRPAPIDLLEPWDASA